MTPNATLLQPAGSSYLTHRDLCLPLGPRNATYTGGTPLRFSPWTAQICCTDIEPKGLIACCYTMRCACIVSHLQLCDNFWTAQLHASACLPSSSTCVPPYPHPSCHPSSPPSLSMDWGFSSNIQRHSDHHIPKPHGWWLADPPYPFSQCQDLRKDYWST